jgi:hypothetical protein
MHTSMNGTDKCIHRWMDGWMDGWMDIETKGGQTECLTDCQTDRQWCAGNPAGRQAWRQTDRQAGRQTDRPEARKSDSLREDKGGFGGCRYDLLRMVQVDIETKYVRPIRYQPVPASAPSSSVTAATMLVAAAPPWRRGEGLLLEPPAATAPMLGSSAQNKQVRVNPQLSHSPPGSIPPFVHFILVSYFIPMQWLSNNNI